MAINVAGQFGKLEKKSGMLIVGSVIGLVASNALSFPPIIGEVFGFFTKLGLLGRVTGWTGRKVTE